MGLVAVLAQIEVGQTGLLVWGVLSVLAGIVILVMPRVLNYIVAVYLIVIGVLQIVAAL
jgi:uncharacterized membrane protein HdeD (DUF308 family)